MKVLVAGATGVAGRRAVPRLVEAGHDVTAVARGPEKAAAVKAAGARPITVDLFDAAAVKEAVQGHEAVVNLTTKIPKPSQMGRLKAWEENDRIRREVSRNLVDGCIASGAERYVQESLAFMYEDRGDQWIDEEVPLDLTVHGQSLQVAEANANRLTASGGIGVVLRFGQFYAPEAAYVPAAERLGRLTLSPFLGPSEAYMALIHADDIGTAVAAALSASAGTYNVVDDEPLTRTQLDQVLATAVGRRRLRRLPSAFIRANKLARLYLRSQRVSNLRFKEAVGWSPMVASAREGIPAVLAQLEESG